MVFLHILRLVVLTISVAFSVVVLGLSADLIETTLSFLGAYFYFTPLAITSAAITTLTAPVLLICDAKRKGAFTSMIVVELPWLSVLWVLWLATAAEAVVANQFMYPEGCALADGLGPPASTTCHEFVAVEAFAFIVWIILMGYCLLLLIFSIIGASRGHKVWTSSVKETNFLAPAPAIVGMVGSSGSPYGEHKPGSTNGTSPPVIHQNHQAPVPPQALVNGTQTHIAQV